MMVKSMSRKSTSFGQLLDYLNQPAQKGPAILQNFRTTHEDFRKIHGEFLENSRSLPPRKNGNILYHEILSFSDLDRERVTPVILEDLTRHYLSLRAPYALAYAKAHFNTASPHVHLMISANDLGSSRRRRLSKTQFQEIKRELERYQKERYPFLMSSIVFSDSRNPSAPRRRRGEHERARRLRTSGMKISSRKDELRELVLRTLTRASSGEAFLLLMAQAGIRLRCRGKTVTLEDQARPGSRRYRLSTLGLEEPFWRTVRQWQALPERIQVLDALEVDQVRQRWGELGFREEVLTVLQVGPKVPAEEVIRERLAALRRVESDRRENPWPKP
jgi:Relaxase/Mobilisation nuclease domain